MEPRDVIDDTNYFRTLREQEKVERGPLKVRHGRDLAKWTIEPRAIPKDGQWLASARLTRATVDGQGAGEELHFPDLGLFDSEHEAARYALFHAQDWIAKQPVE